MIYREEFGFEYARLRCLQMQGLTVEDIPQKARNMSLKREVRTEDSVESHKCNHSHQNARLHYLQAENNFILFSLHLLKW